MPAGLWAQERTSVATAFSWGKIQPPASGRLLVWWCFHKDHSWNPTGGGLVGERSWVKRGLSQGSVIILHISHGYIYYYQYEKEACGFPSYALPVQDKIPGKEWEFPFCYPRRGWWDLFFPAWDFLCKLLRGRSKEISHCGVCFWWHNLSFHGKSEIWDMLLHYQKLRQKWRRYRGSKNSFSWAKGYSLYYRGRKSEELKVFMPK